MHSAYSARIMVLVLLLVGCASARQDGSSASASDDWPMFRGDLLNTGKSRSKTDATKGLVKWKFVAGAKTTQSPIVYKGVVYIGDWQGAFYALDAKKGTVVWQSPALPKLAHPRTGKGIPQGYTYSNPCIVDDKVVSCTQNGLVSAYRLSDGKIVWQRKIDGEVYSSLRSAGGKILFGSKNFNWYALDASNGEILWTYECGDIVGSTCAVTKSGRVIFPSHDKYLHSLDLETGKLRKKWRVGYRSTGTPAIHFGAAYFCATGRKFICFDLFTGTIKWDTPCLSEYQQGIGVWKDQVMVHIGKYLMAYDANTGKNRYRRRLLGSGAVSPCIGVDQIYISDAKGGLSTFDLATGDMKWQAQLAEGSWSSPCLVDGLVYVADGQGTVAAFE